MAVIKTVELSLHDDYSVSLALYSGVSNIKELKQCVMNQTVDVALIKPQMILDVFQVLVAANKAVHLNKYNKRVTKTIHSEVLYSLSPSKNISDCFRKFGVEDIEKELLVVEVHKTGEGRLKEEVIPLVKGELMELDNLQHFSNKDLIQKVYKIKEEPELKETRLLDSIVSRMASKDFVTV